MVIASAIRGIALLVIGVALLVGSQIWLARYKRNRGDQWTAIDGLIFVVVIFGVIIIGRATSVIVGVVVALVAGIAARGLRMRLRR
jgi:NhaP-type Na+/H+ or K+/H+ antiporter